MTVSALGWLILSVYFFSFRLHGRRFPVLETGMVAVTLAVTLATLPGLVPLATLGTLATLIFFCTTLLSTACMVTASWRSHSREGLAVSLCCALYLPLGTNDGLMQSYKIDIEGLYLLPYGVLPTLLVLMAVLQTRYIRALETVEASNLLLETRLAERERELENSHRKLREIEHRQMLARERQRLMRDMHDGIGSSLMTAISVVEARETSSDDVISTILRDCVDDLKLTIDSLEPVEADLLLLLAALRFRLEPRFAETGLTLLWQVEDLPRLPWLEPASALQVLRIFQEVFTNVIKHAGAGEIRVNTGVRGDGVYVAVRNDGSGFAVEEALGEGDGDKPRPRGRGLPNIIHRADELGGKASWSEGGKCFELWLPLTA
jgi:signal transduction histidine kinase